jgi:hypothetical protein
MQPFKKRKWKFKIEEVGMKAKKVLSLVLVVIIAMFSLAACADDNRSNSRGNTGTTAPPVTEDRATKNPESSPSESGQASSASSVPIETSAYEYRSEVDYTDAQGYSYHVVYEFTPKLSIDTTAGAPGYVGIVLDGSGSITVTNTTSGKKAWAPSDLIPLKSELDKYIMPIYSVADYDEFSGDGYKRFESGGIILSLYLAVDLSNRPAATSASASSYYSFDVGETKVYPLVSRYSSVNVIPESEQDRLMNPIGWGIEIPSIVLPPKYTVAGDIENLGSWYSKSGGDDATLYLLTS